MQVWYFYDVPLPNRYAATIQILRTGAALAAQGVRFTLLAGELTAPVDRILDDYGLDGRPELRVEPFFRRFDPGLLGSLRRRRAVAAFRRRLDPASGPHVVMTRGETGLGLLPAFARGPREATLVYEMHRIGWLREAERRAGRVLSAATIPPELAAAREAEARAIAVADGLVYLTEGVRQAVQADFAPAAPHLVLPSGVEPVAAGSAPAPDHDLVYAGKLSGRKGAPDLLQALLQMRGRSLLLIGGAPDEAARLREEAARLGLSNRVEVTGWVPPAEVGRQLRRGRVGVCPLPEDVDSISARFTSPMKLLEMMAHGLPVVAADLPTVRAIAGTGEALLVPPGQPSLLARAAETLLSDPAQAAALAEAGRLRSRDFAWDRRAERLAGFLARLTARAQAAAC